MPLVGDQLPTSLWIFGCSIPTFSVVVPFWPDTILSLKFDKPRKEIQWRLWVFSEGLQNLEWGPRRRTFPAAAEPSTILTAPSHPGPLSPRPQSSSRMLQRLASISALHNHRTFGKASWEDSWAKPRRSIPTPIYYRSFNNRDGVWVYMRWLNYIVEPRKLEHGCRRISARIPYTLP